jgi:hypothetical protein
MYREEKKVKFLSKLALKCSFLNPAAQVRCARKGVPQILNVKIILLVQF